MWSNAFRIIWLDVSHVGTYIFKSICYCLKNNLNTIQMYVATYETSIQIIWNAVHNVYHRLVCFFSSETSMAEEQESSWYKCEWFSLTPWLSVILSEWANGQTFPCITMQWSEYIRALTKGSMELNCAQEQESLNSIFTTVNDCNRKS